MALRGPAMANSEIAAAGTSERPDLARGAHGARRVRGGEADPPGGQCPEQASGGIPRWPSAEMIPYFLDMRRHYQRTVGNG